MSSEEPIRVGLVGAGPWASMFHAPVIAAGPETRLVGVWARRPGAAEDLAARHSTVAFASYEELMESCEVVAFAVPPAVQASMAIRAAAAGKALLLDKPIASSLDEARRLTEAVTAAGVASMVVLTARYVPTVRAQLAEWASRSDLLSADYEAVTGAFLSGPFSQSPWRHEQGALFDLGPHGLDLLAAVLGPVESVQGICDGGWVRLQMRHAGRGVSRAVLCATYAGPSVQGLRVRSATGSSELPSAATAVADVPAVVRQDLYGVVRNGASHPCSVQRGLELQAIIAAAADAIASGETVAVPDVSR